MVAACVASLGLVFVGGVSVIPDRLVVVPLEVVVGLGAGRSGGSIPAPGSAAASDTTATTAVSVLFFVFFATAVVVLRGGVIGPVVVAVGYNAFLFVCGNM